MPLAGGSLTCAKSDTSDLILPLCAQPAAQSSMARQMEALRRKIQAEEARLAAAKAAAASAQGGAGRPGVDERGVGAPDRPVASSKDAPDGTPGAQPGAGMLEASSEKGRELGGNGESKGLRGGVVSGGGSPGAPTSQEDDLQITLTQ